MQIYVLFSFLLCLTNLQALPSSTPIHEDEPPSVVDPFCEILELPELKQLAITVYIIKNRRKLTPHLPENWEGTKGEKVIEALEHECDLPPPSAQKPELSSRDPPPRESSPKLPPEIMLNGKPLPSDPGGEKKDVAEWPVGEFKKIDTHPTYTLYRGRIQDLQNLEEVRYCTPRAIHKASLRTLDMDPCGRAEIDPFSSEG